MRLGGPGDGEAPSPSRSHMILTLAVTWQSCKTHRRNGLGRCAVSYIIKRVNEVTGAWHRIPWAIWNERIVKRSRNVNNRGRNKKERDSRVGTFVPTARKHRNNKKMRARRIEDEKARWNDRRDRGERPRRINEASDPNSQFLPRDSVSVVNFLKRRWPIWPWIKIRSRPGLRALARKTFSPFFNEISYLFEFSLISLSAWVFRLEGAETGEGRRWWGRKNTK